MDDPAEPAAPEAACAECMYLAEELVAFPLGNDSEATDSFPGPDQEPSAHYFYEIHDVLP